MSYQLFSSEVIEKLGAYVYRLIDPRNGETFYVGKGKGNRIFAHIRDELKNDGDEIEDKLKRIREIRVAGLEVNHVIHRHGMDSKTAFEVESALIDAYSGLTNIMGGHAGNEFGVAHADELINRYNAEEVVFKHKVLLININHTSSERSIYDATRFAWKIDYKKAARVDYILAVVRGIVKGVFIGDKWLEATFENFPEFGISRPGRFGFIGKEATSNISQLYFNKRIPSNLRKKGASNPIRYVMSSKT